MLPQALMPFTPVRVVPIVNGDVASWVNTPPGPIVNSPTAEPATPVVFGLVRNSAREPTAKKVASGVPGPGGPGFSNPAGTGVTAPGVRIAPPPLMANDSICSEPGGPVSTNRVPPATAAAVGVSPAVGVP